VLVGNKKYQFPDSIFLIRLHSTELWLEFLKTAFSWPSPSFRETFGSRRLYPTLRSTQGLAPWKFLEQVHRQFRAHGLDVLKSAGVGAISASCAYGVEHQLHKRPSPIGAAEDCVRDALALSALRAQRNYNLGAIWHYNGGERKIYHPLQLACGGRTANGQGASKGV